MNKLTKVGLSALCGSLASVAAANAGALEVTGGATATWTSLQGQQTGNPLGMDSALTFKGSGELDGGQTFSVSLVHLDQEAGYSSGNITLNTNSLGTFVLSQKEGGGGIGGYDDKMPTAWEETWGTGLGTGVDLAKGVGSSTNINWASPSYYGTVLKIAYAGKNDGVSSNDKAVSGVSTGAKGAGLDVVLDINAYGANLFVGGSESNLDPGSTSKKRTSDHQEAVAGFTYTFGPVKAGIQKTGEWFGSQLGGDVDYYDNTAWGVSFNVSDDLSISYGEFKSKKGYIGKSVSEGPTGWNTARDMDFMEAKSLQLAYTMGGASIKIAETSVDNANYVTNQGSTFDTDGTTIALSLAF
jgi:hypothetical protein